MTFAAAPQCAGLNPRLPRQAQAAKTDPALSAHCHHLRKFAYQRRQAGAIVAAMLGEVEHQILRPDPPGEPQRAAIAARPVARPGQRPQPAAQRPVETQRHCGLPLRARAHIKPCGQIRRHAPVEAGKGGRPSRLARQRFAEQRTAAVDHAEAVADLVLGVHFGADEPGEDVFADLAIGAVEAHHPAVLADADGDVAELPLPGGVGFAGDRDEALFVPQLGLPALRERAGEGDGVDQIRPPWRA